MRKRIGNSSLGLGILFFGISQFLIIQCAAWSESGPGYLTHEKNILKSQMIPSWERSELKIPTIIRTIPDPIEDARNAVFSALASNESQTAEASGFFISKSGVALSSYHVFENFNKSQVKIKLNNGEVLKIDKILARNSQEDYIVFQVMNHSSTFPYLSFAQKEEETGAKIFALGMPSEQDPLILQGLISGYMNNRIYLETSMKIPVSCIGGPLLNQRGEVIGIAIDSRNEAGHMYAVNTDILQLDRFTGK